MMLSSRFIFLFSFFIGFVAMNPSPLLAQKLKTNQKEEMRRFKNGTLVIRLKTSDNRIKRIEDQMAQSSKNGTVYNNLLLEKRKLLEADNRYNTELIRAFRDFYTFSDYVIIYNRDFPQFKEGKRENIFLNDSLEWVSLERSLQSPIYYFVQGSTISNGNSLTGLLVLNEDNELMPSWFPKYFRDKNNWKSFWNLFFSSDNLYRPAEINIKKFQHKLERLWERVD